MMWRLRLPALVMSLVILNGCAAGPSSKDPVTAGGFAPRAVLEAREEDAAGLNAQLGLLVNYITTEERQALQEIWDKVSPIRADRLAQGKYEKSEYEIRLLKRLNKLYEEYTIKYLGGDDGGWGYANPKERILAEYRIHPDGTLLLNRDSLALEGEAWTEEDFLGLWNGILKLLPQGAFQGFTRFTVFTDGVEETMAYVYALDAKGTRWEIAVDPADAVEEELFTETVLHEYAHYLTLNADEVDYGFHQTVDTYNEDGMISKSGSYIDDFYQAFWTDYLDDRLVNMDSFNFFLRHYDDFINPYASTDPSEDICESFTYFVLRPRDPDAASDVWSQKLDFFYDYPELVEFRQTVRDGLGLAEEEYYESFETDAA